MLRAPLILLVLILGAASHLFAAPEALIVIGLAGGQAEADEFSATAKTISEAVEKRGGTVRTIGPQFEGSAREAILKGLAKGESLGAADEFWLVLLGHSAPGKDGTPSFQVKGPRLTSSDLREALARIPARKFVFAATEYSGGYLDALKMPGCDILSATEENGQISSPRYPGHWANMLAENPSGDLKTIASKASETMEAEFTSLGVARNEQARYLDADSGKTLAPPFGTDVAGNSAPAMASLSAATRFDPNKIVIPKSSGNSLFEQKPASDETREILAAAKAIENPQDSPALILRSENRITTDNAGAVDDERTIRVYLARADAVDQWANWSFRQNRPVYESKILAARIILPDASSWVLNSVKLQKEAAGGLCCLLFPQAQAGSVIELATLERNRPDFNQPIFYREFPLQDHIPTLSRSITLNYPKNKPLSTFVHNLKSAEAEKSETPYSQVLKWEFKDLPAFESLPDSPPDRLVRAWLGVSSIGSWREFSDWYRHITEGAFVVGPKVKAKAAELASSQSGRMEKIRAAFEYVAALRYVAIELGIGGLSPRTPEQTLENGYGDCKDKANLLIALLKEMGIPAEYALVNRMNATIKEFPGWQFNHAIAYLPPEKGSAELWLDSTDTSTPFGLIAPGNIEREALVFSETDADFRRISLASDSTAARSVQTWKMRETPEGQWKGTLIDQPAGLQEYFYRINLSPLLPQARRQSLLKDLTKLLDGADFTGIKIENLVQPGSPLKIEAAFTNAPRPWPQAGSELWDKVLSPSRDRDLLLNDGRPMILEQRVSASFAEAPATLPQDLSLDAAGQHFSIRYQKTGDREVERVAVCEIKSPLVAAADYAAFRSALRQWISQLEKF